jgi:hypothetical protein
VDLQTGQKKDPNIEAMPEQGWLTMTFAELEEFLNKFEKKRIITSSEHAALLALARQLITDPSHKRDCTS